jgi:hypothetical protein
MHKCITVELNKLLVLHNGLELQLLIGKILKY